jgi:hypothetical protein
VLDTRHDLSLGRAVTPEPIRDDQSGYIPRALQQLPEELLSCSFISAALDQDVGHLTLLVDGTPEVMSTPVDLEEHFIEVPSVTGSRTPTA